MSTQEGVFELKSMSKNIMAENSQIIGLDFGEGSVFNNGNYYSTEDIDKFK